MANKLKTAWQANKAVVNGWLAIPNAFSAEMFSRAGWDSVTVDMQHGVQDYLSCVACFQGMQSSGVVPMVRVPWNEPGIIGKVLDAGAYGVICPMVNTEAEARALVQYAKYPPKGTRSNGPIRAGLYGEAGNYQKTANDEIVLMPMIETKTAIGNIDAILDVPGIDAIYIGPSDLSFSLRQGAEAGCGGPRDPEDLRGPAGGDRQARHCRGPALWQRRICEAHDQDGLQAGDDLQRGRHHGQRGEGSSRGGTRRLRHRA